MAFDLAEPLFAVSGTALLAILTYAFWPEIYFRFINQTYNRIQMTDVCIGISTRVKGSNKVPRFQLAMYFVLKLRK